jgi:hypothetical protein
MHTILGKTLLICIAIFYTTENILYGVLFVLLAIVFYQRETVEGMMNYSELSHGTKEAHTTMVRNDDFKAQHCRNGHLEFKNAEIKPEMTEHIFPEVEFEDSKCNVCDPSCKFSITELMKTTDVLQLQNE